jgi:hypothetical protein
MEPIAIALIVSVLFNWYCFKEIKSLNYELNHVKEQNIMYTINTDIISLPKQPKLKTESLGFVNVYIKPNGNYIISSIPRSKWEIKRKRSQHPINMLLGTSEVFITKPEK